MVDGSSAPIVLLDFDGVLNAFPDAIGVRYEDVGVAPVVECRGRMTDDFGPERAFRLDGVDEYLTCWGPGLLRLGAIMSFGGYCVSRPGLLRLGAVVG